MHHNFKEIKVWNKAVDFSVKVYQVTSSFPNDEKYALISQLRRSSVSIPSNIAEGAGRTSNKEFVHFLNIAKGSAFELETQLIIAEKLKYISNIELQELDEKIKEIQKMIFGFIKTLQS